MNNTTSAPPLAVPPFRPPLASFERMLQSGLLHRLDDRDRALYLRWVIGESASRATLFFWTVLTHMGGITASVVFALVPLLAAEGQLKVSAVQAAWTLSISLLIVQAIKRIVVRARPTEGAQVDAHVHLPDRFSFPSGHAAAS